MSFMDKFMSIMHLNDVDDDDDEITYGNDDYDLDEEEEVKKPAKAPRHEKAAEPRQTSSRAEAPREKERERSQMKAMPNISSFNKSSRKQVAGMEVCVIKPSSMEDAREITETLLNGRCVLVNMEGLSLDIAQRIIDFISGSCFAISGNLQKVSSYIFIITPPNVDISGDFQEMLDTLV